MVVKIERTSKHQVLGFSVLWNNRHGITVAHPTITIAIPPGDAPDLSQLGKVCDLPKSDYSMVPFVDKWDWIPVSLEEEAPDVTIVEFISVSGREEYDQKIDDRL